jgi:hypothetical protein
MAAQRFSSPARSRPLGRWSTCVAAVMFLVALSVPASAATITLDFDTPTTGSLIIGTPLVTSLGTITATNAELFPLSDPELTAAGATGNTIDHLGSIINPVGTLLFDFNVDAITLIYGGNLGDITIQVRDASNLVLDSFFQADTGSGQPAGPITLSGSGIRSLEWFESGGSYAALDNIAITANEIAAPVPEPASLTLLGLGLAGIAGRRWRQRKAS